MNSMIKQVYVADDIALIRKALEHYADALEKTAQGLTDIDERYERYDTLITARAARTLAKDFE